MTPLSLWWSFTPCRQMHHSTEIPQNLSKHKMLVQILQKYHNILSFRWAGQDRPQR